MTPKQKQNCENCQSLATEVKDVAKRRKEVVNHQHAFKKKGCTLLKLSEMLVLKSTDMEADTYPLYSINSTHTKFDVLKLILPNNLLVGIMVWRYKEKASKFTISKERATKGETEEAVTGASTEGAGGRAEGIKSK
eukprot:10425813-Ditylum_brightwellii.AAC.1